MSDPAVLAPQLLVDSEQLVVCYEADDKDALKALVPDGFAAVEPGFAFINQYRVRDPSQLSNGGHPNGWGAYSLTYLGMEIAGYDLYDGTATRWWTHYYNSSPAMTDYALARGIPAGPGGRTEHEIGRGQVTATTFLEGKPIIRTQARFSDELSPPVSGQLQYMTRHEGEYEVGRYPFVGVVQEDFELVSMEFLDSDSSVYALRPQQPFNLKMALFTPKLAVCYPGGQQKLGEAPF